MYELTDVDVECIYEAIIQRRPAARTSVGIFVVDGIRSVVKQKEVEDELPKPADPDLTPEEESWMRERAREEDDDADYVGGMML